MPDHLIIGGGISGMLAAREQRLVNADVTLLERNTTGRESSWAGVALSRRSTLGDSPAPLPSLPVGARPNTPTCPLFCPIEPYAKNFSIRREPEILPIISS